MAPRRRSWYFDTCKYQSLQVTPWRIPNFATCIYRSTLDIVSCARTTVAFYHFVSFSAADCSSLSRASLKESFRPGKVTQESLRIFKTMMMGSATQLSLLCMCLSGRLSAAFGKCCSSLPSPGKLQLVSRRLLIAATPFVMS